MGRSFTVSTGYLGTTSCPRLPQTTGTLALWIRPTGAWGTVYGGCVQITDGTNEFTIHSHATNGLMYAGWNPSSGDKRVTFPWQFIRIYQWNLLILTWDTGANETKCYVNNHLVASGQATTWDTLNSTLRLGNFSGQAHPNDQSHFSCWSRVLNSTEMTNLWNRADPTGISNISFNYLITGDASPETDTQGGTSLTVTGTTKSGTDPYYGLIAGFLHKRKITIDHTKVAATESGYHLSFAGTYSWLATEANGGLVTNASGADIAFTSDSAGTALLKSHRASYGATDGAVSFYILIPSASSSVDTELYIWYGNSAVTDAYQYQDYIGVWGWDLTLRSSMEQPAVAMYDSSNSSNDLVNGGSKVAGITDYATDFGGTAMLYPVRTPILNPPASNGPVTLSIWFKKSSAAARTQQLIGMGNAVENQLIELVERDTSTLELDFYNHGMSFSWTPDTNWHHLVGVMVDATEANAAMYLDGVSKTLTSINPGTMNLGADIITVSRWVGSAAGAYYGVMDEAAIYRVARTQDQITTEYNNVSSPGTFYSIGDDLIVSGGGLLVGVSILVLDSPLVSRSVLVS